MMKVLHNEYLNLGLLFKNSVKIIPEAMNADDFLNVLTFLDSSSVFFLKMALHYIVRNKVMLFMAHSGRNCIVWMQE